MNKWLTGASLIVTTLTLPGCEGNTTYEAVADNRTETGIRIKAEPAVGETTDTVLMPGASITLYIWDKRGGSSDPANPSGFFRSLTITNQQGDTVTRDYTLMENWEMEIEHRKKVPSDYYHRYTFVAGPGDF